MQILKKIFDNFQKVEVEKTKTKVLRRGLKALHREGREEVNGPFNWYEVQIEKTSDISGRVEKKRVHDKD